MDAAPVIPESASASETDEQVSEPVVVTPETYVCFGTIDESHPECQKCQFNKECAVKSAGK